MTDRDTFAAAALTGLLADESLRHLDDITLAIRAYELSAAMADRRDEITRGPARAADGMAWPTSATGLRLTDDEREAVYVAMHRCDGPEYKTLRNLLARLA